MGKKLKYNIAIISSVCLICGMLCGFALPQEIAGEAEINADGYESVAVYVDGILTTSGYIVEAGVVYMSVKGFCEALELPFTSVDPGDGCEFCATMGGVAFEVADGAKYMTAEGRSFYLADGSHVINRDYCLPVAEMAALICAEVMWDPATGSIDIDTTLTGELESGDTYYDNEDLLWLARIITAESGNQSIEGMMGVGNVVLNRVADDSCPDTVYGVIFDTRFGVQFSPVETGSIYCEPNEKALVAAKLCLEGYNVVGACMYFVNPETGVTSWFRDTRTFVASIGDHDFYA
ncbi:MAG: cell wall hydrolase [Clostridia bacterium]|nr:cell wall hydrolase [Clostridia bacterium]